MLGPNDLNVKLRHELPHFDLDLSFQCRSHVTGIFGPSGCGKTTLLEILCGIRKPSYARIDFGKSCWQDSDRKVFLPPEQRGIGYVAQHGLLFPHLSVYQNLRIGSRRALAKSIDVKSVFEQVTQLFELEPLFKRKVGLLSGGERQRVALGRALCSAPSMLILDEPLASLDLAMRRKILPYLKEMRDTFNIPILIVSHDRNEVQALCDELLVIKEGKLIAWGRPREVLLDPLIYPFGEEEGFENMIPCQLVNSSAHCTTLNMGETSTGIELNLNHLGRAIEGASHVGIRSRDILLATQFPQHISARNIWTARVQSITPRNSTQLVILSLHRSIPLLAAELSEASCIDLALRPGSEVFMIVKSMACTLYESHAGVTTQKSNTAQGHKARSSGVVNEVARVQDAQQIS